MSIDLEEISDAEYLRNLMERIGRIPGTYGVDGYDMDRLREIASKLEQKKEEA